MMTSTCWKVSRFGSSLSISRIARSGDATLSGQSHWHGVFVERRHVSGLPRTQIVAPCSTGSGPAEEMRSMHQEPSFRLKAIEPSRRAITVKVYHVRIAKFEVVTKSIERQRRTPPTWNPSPSPLARKVRQHPNVSERSRPREAGDKGAAPIDRAILVRRNRGSRIGRIPCPAATRCPQGSPPVRSA